MSNQQFEIQVVDRITGEVDWELTEDYNEYLKEDVEGMNLPSRYRIQLRNS